MTPHFEVGGLYQSKTTMILWNGPLTKLKGPSQWVASRSIGTISIEEPFAVVEVYVNYNTGRHEYKVITSRTGLSGWLSVSTSDLMKYCEELKC